MCRSISVDVSTNTKEPRRGTYSWIGEFETLAAIVEQIGVFVARCSSTVDEIIYARCAAARRLAAHQIVRRALDMVTGGELMMRLADVSRVRAGRRDLMMVRRLQELDRPRLLVLVDDAEARELLGHRFRLFTLFFKAQVETHL